MRVREENVEWMWGKIGLAFLHHLLQSSAKCFSMRNVSIDRIPVCLILIAPRVDCHWNREDEFHHAPEKRKEAKAKVDFGLRAEKCQTDRLRSNTFSENVELESHKD